MRVDLTSFWFMAAALTGIRNPYIGAGLIGIPSAFPPNRHL